MPLLDRLFFFFIFCMLKHFLPAECQTKPPWSQLSVQSTPKPNLNDAPQHTKQMPFEQCKYREREKEPCKRRVLLCAITFQKQSKSHSIKILYRNLLLNQIETLNEKRMRSEEKKNSNRNELWSVHNATGCSVCVFIHYFILFLLLLILL